MAGAERRGGKEETTDSGVVKGIRASDGTLCL